MTTTDDLRHLNLESRMRLDAVTELKEQNRLILLHSSLRLDASRLLLAQHQHVLTQDERRALAAHEQHPPASRV